MTGLFQFTMRLAIETEARFTSVQRLTDYSKVRTAGVAAVGCVTSRQHASVSQGRICLHSCRRCHTETKVANQTHCLIWPLYAYTGPTSPRAEPIMPGAWHGCCWSTTFDIPADLPARPYLAVLVRKLAGSTDVRPYFSKYRHRVSRKYGNCDVNECKFVASQADGRALMGSYRSLTLAYFKSFPRLKYTASPDWSKKFVKPMDVDFASKLYVSWPSSYMVG